MKAYRSTETPVRRVCSFIHSLRLPRGPCKGAPKSCMADSLLADLEPDPLPDPAHLALQPDVRPGLGERIGLLLVLSRARISLGQCRVVVIEHFRVHTVLEGLAALVGANGHAGAQSSIAVRYAAQTTIDGGLGQGGSPLDGFARGGGRILAFRILMRGFRGSLLRPLPERRAGGRSGAASAGRRRWRWPWWCAEGAAHLRAEAQHECSL